MVLLFLLTFVALILILFLTVKLKRYIRIIKILLPVYTIYEVDSVKVSKAQ